MSMECKVWYSCSLGERRSRSSPGCMQHIGLFKLEPSPQLSCFLHHLRCRLRARRGRGTLGHRSGVRLGQRLGVALLAVLEGYFNQRLESLARGGLGFGVQLTVHLEILISISPRRSAASLMSSFKLRRTAREATAR